MCEVKANQTWKDADGSEVTVVSVRKANAKQMRDMHLQFASALRAGYDSQEKIVFYREDRSRIVDTMTLGGFLRQFHQ